MDWSGNVNAQQDIDILDKQLGPVICKHLTPGDFIFQDDNTSIHRDCMYPICDLVKPDPSRVTGWSVD